MPAPVGETRPQRLLTPCLRSRRVPALDDSAPATAGAMAEDDFVRVAAGCAPRPPRAAPLARGVYCCLGIVCAHAATVHHVVESVP